MTGKNNEDHFAIFSYQVSKADKRPAVLAIVADGVGGKQAGEVASETAVRIIQKAVEESDGGKPVEILSKAYFDAGEAIIEQAGQHMDQQGMGTTATVACVIEDRLYGMNVGNSRLYLLRKGALRQISIDHSWVQEAMEHGAITPEQARNHPNSHVITRYLGSEKMTPDARLRLSDGETDEESEKNQGMKLLAGDLLFLCSDGLSDVVEDHEIEAALNEGGLVSALDHLIALANTRGGPDNITVVSMLVPDMPVRLSKGIAATGRGRLARLGIYLASSAILALILLIWWLYLR